MKPQEARPVYIFLPGASAILKMFTMSRASAKSIRVLNGDSTMRVPRGCFAYNFEDARAALVKRWKHAREQAQVQVLLSERVLEHLQATREEDVAVVDPRTHNTRVLQ